MAGCLHLHKRPPATAIVGVLQQLNEHKLLTVGLKPNQHTRFPVATTPGLLLQLLIVTP
jgi:hypothetical protein